jgi:hypothetical protein
VGSIADNFARVGLGVIATATGQSLAYRAGTSGTWTALPAQASLVEDMPMPIGYDGEAHRAVYGKATAKLFIPYGTTHMLPGSILKGYQVRKTVGATNTEWAVISAQHTDGFSIYDCERMLPQTVGAVPGGI